MIPILLLSLYSVGSLAYADDDPDILVELKLRDLKEIDRQTQEYPILKNLVQEQQNKINELNKALDGERKSNELSQKEIELMKQKEEVYLMRIAAQEKAFADMKDVADRAIKLAETGQKSDSIWRTIGMILGGIALGIAVGVGL